MSDTVGRDTVIGQVGGRGAERGRVVKVELTMREFDLPPIGDGVLIGRRAAIGPRGLYEAIDRMLPGLYELIPIDDHSAVEAIIVRSTKLRIIRKEVLVDLFLRQAETMMTDTTILRVDLDCEVAVQLELET